MDTIFALATAQGKAGVAVIRISGSLAMLAGEKLAGKLPVSGRSLRKLRAASGEVIDEALVLTFAAGHSFTGEDVVELHVHGSRAVVASVTQELRAMAGVRPAEAGEFTRRAFECGRIDLSQVEGLADLIESETEAQRRAAMQQMSGGLRDLADRCRGRLLRATALIEATIDFADEDVPVDVAPEVGALIDAILPELRHEVQGFGAAERLRQGFEVVILGAPNAGKSTLLNAIAGREAAITSAIAGTTRDLIEVQVDLGGLPVTFVDTAGLRETEDEVEKIGVSRARARAMTADLRIGLRVAGESVADQDLGDLAVDLFVNAKSDLLVPGERDAASVSGKTGEGVAELLAAIKEILSGRMAGAGLINRVRHLEAVAQAIVALETGRSALSNGQDAAEFVAEHLRDARMALDRLTGRIDVEAILGEIFSSFCIGK